MLGPLEGPAGVPAVPELMPALARRFLISTACSRRNLSDSVKADSISANLAVKYWTCSVSCWAVAVADGPEDAGGVSILGR